MSSSHRSRRPRPVVTLTREHRDALRDSVEADLGGLGDAYEAEVTPSEQYHGEDLMNEVYDLISRRLPQLPADDPLRRPLAEMLPAIGEFEVSRRRDNLLRRPLAEMLPAIGEHLGRPRLLPVEGGRK